MRRGTLIDCSRAVERHAYYPRLVDFLADRGMDTLVLHFCDDHGLSIALPGFEDIAQPHALSPDEVRALVDRGERRGVDVVPEVATFGHTRYLTEHPCYRHLHAGPWTDRRVYNAVDPLNPETVEVMRRLFEETTRLFPSPLLHIGCDEVDLSVFCEERALDPGETWVGHANRMIGLALDAGRTPLLWADHLVKDPAVAAGVDKRAVPVWWDYTRGVEGDAFDALTAAGFERVWVAPSTSNGRIRFLPTAYGLDNVDRMAAIAANRGAAGFLNTLWEPPYGLQGAHDHGIAYGAAAAAAAAAGGAVDRPAFNERFVREVFGVDPSTEVSAYLAGWPELHIDEEVTYWLVGHRDTLSEAGWEGLREVNRVGRDVLPRAASFEPERNGATWAAMRLAGEAAWLVSEWSLLGRDGGEAERKRACDERVARVRAGFDEQWDRTRFPDDPRKRGSSFPSDPYNHASVLLACLTPLAGVGA